MSVHKFDSVTFSKTVLACRLKAVMVLRIQGLVWQKQAKADLS
jgi:hypothetical protein